MIAIVDYGAGNIFSLKNALDFLGEKSVLTASERQIRDADAVILPGVGAFPDAIRMLREQKLDALLREQAAEKPLLGICLGMQMLFETGFEFTKTDGLALISGRVERIDTPYKIPHMGWNELVPTRESRLLHGVKAGDCVYFVHSYMAHTAAENVSAFCEYGCKIPALVEKGHVYGAQFHPEKSGEVGLSILKNFCELS